MEYRESQLDRDNKSWFWGDKSIKTLISLNIINGHIRGVYPTKVNFEYPISVFVGENGSGKSTILSLISCAFHNDTEFCPQSRIRQNVKKERRYYTYGDFFTFTPGESGISEIQIQTEFFDNNETKCDVRKKKPSGKWNDFNRRPKRAVSFLGINRILPPSESNPHRHYYNRFETAQELPEVQVDELRNAMSKIFSKRYTDIRLLKYGSYRLFYASQSQTDYTGFNMGAGENAVMGMLLEIMTAGRGALIVIDEIELALHARAQIQLIQVLKELCKKYHCQIVCSTHSKIVLEAVPPEARFYVSKKDRETEVLPRISPEYAFEQLSGIHGQELKVLVEDEVGQAFLKDSLPLAIKERVSFLQIGSDQAILRQMAAYYREKNYRFIAFLDGDKRGEKSKGISQIKSFLETRFDHEESIFNELIEKRLCYLPGTTWPERHLIEKTLTATEKQQLLANWDISENDLDSFLEEALSAGKHSEFYSLANNTQIDIAQVRTDIVRNYKLNNRNDIDQIEEIILDVLGC